MRAMAVHGGAGESSPELREPHRAGILEALAVGTEVLKQGGNAVDAAVSAVEALEDNPVFNAGYGSVLNQEGAVEMDAGLMDGTTLDIGAVAAVVNVANPIGVCKYLLNQPSIFFVKEDVTRLAILGGIPLIDPSALVTEKRYRQWVAGQRGKTLDMGQSVDTVGAVALDEWGNLAAATSTGGISRKPPGRIGDAPLPGCGFYADSRSGACSGTGWGESIARIVMSRRAVEFLEQGVDVKAAAAQAVAALERIPGGSGGLILLDRLGRFGFARNTKSMTHAWWNEAGDHGVEA